MYLTRKRRSWPMLFPHSGDSPAARYCFRNSRVCCSASASVVLLSLTRCVRPLAPWVLVHHSSMLSSRLSGCLMAITGPSATRFSSESVMMVAISMIRSFSGSNPVISRSIQTSRLPLLITYDTYAVIFGCWCRCGVAFRKTLLRHILVTLGLRHPWLRTFPESNTTPALHAKLLAASKPETHSGDRGAGRGHLSGSI